MIEVKYPFCHWRPPALFAGFFWFLKQYIINSDSCGYSYLCLFFFLLQRFTLPQEQSHSTKDTGKSLPFKVCVSHHLNFLSGLVTYHLNQDSLTWQLNFHSKELSDESFCLSKKKLEPKNLEVCCCLLMLLFHLLPLDSIV